ncbi:MAG TPA: hypothetical protein VN980_02430 [Alphaproteobacteria bacterium]|nr:hypothetical protein [Alphaproteobacteria bacterium]
MSIGLIPRNRLKWIPKRYKLAHAYCFFLHDECVRALVEYEAARAHLVTINFESQVSAEEFQKLAEKDPTEALLRTGYPDEARRVVVNAITMGMVSDCLHHIFEALKCFEKRKIVVGFNLLRKPLKQNLLYLAWMLGDEDGFYTEFMSGNPENLSQKKVGSLRKEIFAKAISMMPDGSPFIPEILERLIYDRKYDSGFERAFEHAVHLITVERMELRTTPQNFNFIFKSYADDDTYDALYQRLPYLLFFLAHTILDLFDRMRRMDEGVKTAFAIRSLFAFSLLEGGEGKKATLKELSTMLSNIACAYCKAPLKVTSHNAGRIVLTDGFRCTNCGKKNLIAFSWAF